MQNVEVEFVCGLLNLAADISCFLDGFAHFYALEIAEKPLFLLLIDPLLQSVHGFFLHFTSIFLIALEVLKTLFFLSFDLGLKLFVVF